VLDVSRPLATYKDLCIDAADPGRMARFWSAALHLDEAEDRGRTWLVRGPTPRHTIWVNLVPDPKVAKHRLHLDVHTGSVAELVKLGATVLDDTLPWTLMADPEGGEFCAFVRAEVPPGRLYELVLDAHDAPALAAWWAALLGGRVVDEGGDERAVGDVPGAPFEWLCVSPTDDPRTGKNRVHVDVVTEDLDAVLAHGATVLRRLGGDVDWDVLADPEGNEFCAFAPRPTE
jgi:hypothetical protein